MRYLIKYEIATYEGKRWVNAVDEEHAIAKVKAWVWKQNPPAMSYERYRVIEVRE